jgi:hypothetical protein
MMGSEMTTNAFGPKASLKIGPCCKLSAAQLAKEAKHGPLDSNCPGLPQCKGQ